MKNKLLIALVLVLSITLVAGSIVALAADDDTEPIHGENVLNPPGTDGYKTIDGNAVENAKEPCPVIGYEAI